MTEPITKRYAYICRICKETVDCDKRRLHVLSHGKKKKEEDDAVY